LAELVVVVALCFAGADVAADAVEEAAPLSGDIVVETVGHFECQMDPSRKTRIDYYELPFSLRQLQKMAGHKTIAIDAEAEADLEASLE
jgi:hypothetical protein